MTLTASEKCQQEKRKTVNGEDILFAMTSLGFENYAEALKVYLSKYREVGVYGNVGARKELSIADDGYSNRTSLTESELWNRAVGQTR